MQTEVSPVEQWTPVAPQPIGVQHLYRCVVRVTRVDVDAFDVVAASRGTDAVEIFVLADSDYDAETRAGRIGTVELVKRAEPYARHGALLDADRLTEMHDRDVERYDSAKSSDRNAVFAHVGYLRSNLDVALRGLRSWERGQIR